MKKPFKKLFGNRVYLEIPEMPKSSILLSEEAQKTWVEEHKMALNKFKVYAVGDAVSTIKEGDIVAVDMIALTRTQGLKLTKELEVLPVSIFEVSMIWE